VVVGVPLNGAMLAMIVDLYLSGVQRRAARCKVLASPLGRNTFFDLAATRSTRHSAANGAGATGSLGGEYPRVVTWPVFLEHKLRELTGVPITHALLDAIHEAFLGLGGRKGYLMLEDLAGQEQTELASLTATLSAVSVSRAICGPALTTASPTGIARALSGGASGVMHGAFADGSQFRPTARARSWHAAPRCEAGILEASSTDDDSDSEMPQTSAGASNLFVGESSSSAIGAASAPRCAVADVGSAAWGKRRGSEPILPGAR
jgi:hypothetical protein